MSHSPADVDAHLPLSPSTFHILLSLADEDRHGYAIILDVETRTDGAVRMSAGTLYRALQRLIDDGLIAESSRRPPRALDDERRRYYRLLPFGAAVAKAETQRLTTLLRVAKARGLMPDPA